MNKTKKFFALIFAIFSFAFFLQNTAFLTTENNLETFENSILETETKNYSGISIDQTERTENIVNLYFFYGTGCPHCEKQKPFLKKMEDKYSNLRVQSFEVWGSKKNRDLMVEFSKKLNANVGGVPFTVVGDKYFTGWLDENSTGRAIENEIICATENACRDVGLEIGLKVETESTGKKSHIVPDSLTLPLIGEIQTKNLSLPIITIIIAAVDGFNPCAMWTLLFLISLLLGMENKVRMWILGTTFIIASASMYFLFLSAWLNLILFIGFIVWIRVLIGLIAVGGGSYYLKEFFKNPESTCKVTKNEKRQKVFNKLKKLTQEKNFWVALIGIILLAWAVNLVELICSAGLPAVYTQILALSELSKSTYYGYLLLYILVFMLDDLLIFFTAMITLQVTGLSGKYARIAHLIGGIGMVIIGILLLFKPEWLMFG